MENRNEKLLSLCEQAFHYTQEKNGAIQPNELLSSMKLLNLLSWRFHAFARPLFSHIQNH